MALKGGQGEGKGLALFMRACESAFSGVEDRIGWAFLAQRHPARDGNFQNYFAAYPTSFVPPLVVITPVPVVLLPFQAIFFVYREQNRFQQRFQLIHAGYNDPTKLLLFPFNNTKIKISLIILLALLNLSH